MSKKKKPLKLKELRYTVIGYYLDNDQPWAEHVKATPRSTKEVADLAVEKLRKSDNFKGELVVVGIFAGHHMEISGWDSTINIPSVSDDPED